MNIRCDHSRRWQHSFGVRGDSIDVNRKDGAVRVLAYFRDGFSGFRQAATARC